MLCGFESDNRQSALCQPAAGLHLERRWDIATETIGQRTGQYEHGQPIGCWSMSGDELETAAYEGSHWF